MSESLPSKEVLLIDVPSGKILDFGGEFVYNFYLPDETVNDQRPAFLRDSSLYTLLDEPEQNESLKEELRKSNNATRIPRYINLEWTRPSGEGLIGNNQNLIQKVSIADNLAKVKDEDYFSGNHFTSIYLVDNGTDGKIQYSIQRALEEILKSQGLDIATLDASPLDVIRLLHQYTSTQIQGNFLAESFIEQNTRAAGIDFINKPKFDEFVTTTSQKLQTLGLRTSINNKFIHDALITAAQQVDNIYGDETLRVLPDAFIKQSGSRVDTDDINKVGLEDYVTDINDIVDFEARSTNTSISEYQLIGYLIKKTEYFPDGTSVVKEPIVIENPGIANFTDLQVKYGTTYGYTIKSVFLVKIPAIDQLGALGMASVLIASQPTTELFIDTRENRPPNVPTDFDVLWNYETNHPYLTWNFPTDSQRDTKYFQIFKRNGINEPFELIKMYDFNDSVTPLSINQMLENNIDPLLVEVLRKRDGTAVPKNYYLDTSFNIGDSAIYAVCAVDAHGLTSNYSMQLEITFNAFKNRIEKRLISISGAPKPYPNFYLKQDLFVDSIKVSNSKNVEVYFNPEFLALQDRSGGDLKLIKTEETSNYNLQMINLDLQKDKIVTIKIDEVRPEPVAGTSSPPGPQVSRRR